MKNTIDTSIFDDLGFAKENEEFCARGKVVISGSCYTGRLEGDRDFGQDVLPR